MPKRYHCEFCLKSFQDTPVARKRHLQGAGHQRNRRLHYDSFKNDVSRNVSGRAEVLYSGLSGEEILQQWLASHPEVLVRYEQLTKKRRRRRRKEVGGGEKEESEVKEESREQGNRGESNKETKRAVIQQYKVTPSAPPMMALRQLPLYLEPFKSVLPPSLMPIQSRTAYPHTLLPEGAPGWG